MGMTLLNELRSLALVQRLKGLDSSSVINAFFANYLAGLLLLKLQDSKGLILINDKQHAKLTSFQSGMSDITFWGRATFYPSDDLVKRSLQHGHAQVLDKMASRILDTRVHKLISVVMGPPSAVDWQELVVSLVILKHRFEINSSYFNKIVLALHNWDNLSSSARRSVVSSSFGYLTQSDPKSALLSRMRELSGSSMLGDVKAMLTKLISFKQLREDDGGGEGTSTGNIATGDQAVTNNAIISRFGPDNAMAGLLTIKGPAPMQVGDEKKKRKLGHVKRQRSFKLIKFKMPTKRNSV